MFQKKISLYRQMILMFLNALSLYKESAFVVQEMLEFVTKASNIRCYYSSMGTAYPGGTFCIRVLFEGLIYPGAMGCVCE
jgi:hypothetical protein